MNNQKNRVRLYSSLLMLGSGILLFRTIKMISDGAMDILMLWVASLLVVELLVDITCFIGSSVWFISNSKDKERLPLITGAIAAILHAFRVLIFALGRFQLFLNFDVRPEHRALHYTRWNWGWVYFAVIMSILGILGVIIIWRIRRRNRLSQNKPS